MTSAPTRPAWARFPPAIRRPGRQAAKGGRIKGSETWMTATAEANANAPVAAGISIDPLRIRGVFGKRPGISTVPHF